MVLNKDTHVHLIDCLKVFERDVFIAGLLKFSGKKWTGNKLVGNPTAYNKFKSLLARRCRAQSHRPFYKFQNLVNLVDVGNSVKIAAFPEWP